MNSLKKFFKASPPANGDLAIIPSGQLYLKRKPGSPKSESECLYTDSAAIIRELSAHKFELIIQKVYAEGEEHLKGDDDDGDELEVTQSFIIDQSLKIYLSNDSGSQTVSWKNSEDEAESFQFVVDETVKSSEVDHFLDTIHACCFERKYQKSSAGATKNQLDEFFYDPEIEALEDEFSSGIDSLISSSKPEYGRSANDDNDDDDDDDDDDDSIFQDAEEEVPPHLSQNKAQFQDIEGDIIFSTPVELRLYDPETNTFQLQDAKSIVTVTSLGDFNFWLGVDSTVGILGTPISSSLGPQFSYEKSAFIFNYIAGDIVVSWLLKFDDGVSLQSFQKAYMTAQWENANRSKYDKIDESEQKYILSSFNDIERDEEMKDYYDDESEEEEEQAHEEEEKSTSKLRSGVNKEEFSDSEDEDETEKKGFFKSSKNRNLTVSYKNDRSYVTRGDRIGFFKVTEDDDMEFITSVKNLSLDGKKSLIPSKMMLHTEDRALVLQGESKDTLYKMDIERGQVVEEWKIKEDLPVVSFGPSQKFNQMTAEPTFTGISSKGLFKVDPRVSGQKFVEGESKSYVTKNDFSSFSTTENGYIAVASNKGDVRLYDRLGVRAKSLIPAIGDSVRSTDVSADGKWVLLTCQTYLILLDTTIKTGDNAGKSRFLKSSAKEPPKIRMLTLSAEHTAFITNKTKKGLNFSHARFNTGLNAKEQTIISSTGPYAISWSLKKILRGDAEPYLIKSYDGNVVDDNFRFGSDKNVIVALEDDVSIVKKRDFRKANRNSLAFTPRRV